MRHATVVSTRSGADRSVASAFINLNAEIAIRASSVTDYAPDYESGTCRFESCLARGWVASSTVEQGPLKPEVRGSNPRRPTIWADSSMDRAQPSEGWGCEFKSRSAHFGGRGLMVKALDCESRNWGFKSPRLPSSGCRLAVWYPVRIRAKCRCDSDHPDQGVAQPGSAPGLEPGGRWFKSNRPDFFLDKPSQTWYSLPMDRNPTEEFSAADRPVRGALLLTERLGLLA